ncbi:MAG: putative exported protein [Rubritepida sp.]|nr:putative exported protein [Rubritepida sp.]
MGRMSKANRAAMVAAAGMVGPPSGGRMAPSTISINGGPEVPFPVLKAALDTVRGRDAPPPPRDDDNDVGGIAVDRLRSIIDRIERLEEERKALGSDITDIYTEAKSAGFNVKVVRQVIRLRKMEPAEVEELETLLDLYRRALGM